MYQIASLKEFIRNYSIEEHRALKTMSYAERSIFSPVTHRQQGDPTDIEEIEELAYFADTMHENRVELIFDRYLNGISKTEFELFKFVNQVTLELTTMLHRPHIALGSLLMHIYQLRLIKQYFGQATNIIEIGPGSGYLSVLLSLQGKNVWTVDITRALTFWQKLLFSHIQDHVGLHGKELIEMGIKNENHESNLTQIPWWEYKEFKVPDTIDLIVVNHAIAEMHPGAVRHMMKLCQQKGIKHIFAQSSGLQSGKNNMLMISYLVEEYGYICERIGQNNFDALFVIRQKSDTNNYGNVKYTEFNRNLIFYEEYYCGLVPKRYFLKSVGRLLIRMGLIQKFKKIKFKQSKDFNVITIESFFSLLKELGWKKMKPPSQIFFDRISSSNRI